VGKFCCGPGLTGRSRGDDPVPRTAPSTRMQLRSASGGSCSHAASVRARCFADGVFRLRGVNARSQIAGGRSSSTCDSRRRSRTAPGCRCRLPAPTGSPSSRNGHGTAPTYLRRHPADSRHAGFSSCRILVTRRNLARPNRCRGPASARPDRRPCTARPGHSPRAASWCGCSSRSAGSTGRLGVRSSSGAS